MKRITKKRVIILAVLCVLLYLIVGMMLPFLKLKEVSQNFQASYKTEKFYGTDWSVDRAAVIEDSVDALDERLRMISQARERIILSTFDMRDGHSTRDILACLLDAADRGVKVQILVDGMNGLLRMEGKNVFYAISSHPGIEIKFYNKVNPLAPWNFHGRMHDKYLITDNQYFLLGGRNTFDYFLGDYIQEDYSLDREVFIYNTAWEEADNKDSALYQLMDYFEAIWKKEECQYFHEDETLQERKNVQNEAASLREHFKEVKKEKPQLFKADLHYENLTVPIKKATLVSNPTNTGGKEPIVWYELKQLMKNAQKKVMIHTPYAVLSEEMYEGLTEIGEKGIEFEMMVNSVENGDNLVASSDYIKNKEKILQTKVSLYEYDGGISSHGKSILVDDNISVIGSYNLDMRSTYVDTELMLVVDSTELNQILSGYLEDMKQDCRKVIDKEHYEVPPQVQVAETGVVKKVIWKVLGVVLSPFRVLI